MAAEVPKLTPEEKSILAQSFVEVANDAINRRFLAEKKLQVIALAKELEINGVSVGRDAVSELEREIIHAEEEFRGLKLLAEGVLSDTSESAGGN